MVLDNHEFVLGFHTEGQPVRVRAQMQLLPGSVGDLHRQPDGFVWQKLLLIQRQIQAHLRRGAEKSRYGQKANKQQLHGTLKHQCRRL